ncbi:hypothetical protein SADUNF_Sadunf05G0192600 [Salix dunnii]|uniref:Bromo domain-containing protein n=1 Tax=Salix dunnii TaxID=1413687 RepID=A0A835K982_9ROSI|nr:hypothetical protein SADUNF_Sadunf05G0192600 [Salix dunnii]
MLAPSNCDSNACEGNQEEGIRRRKFNTFDLGSDDLDVKGLKGTNTLHGIDSNSKFHEKGFLGGSSVEPGPTTPLPDKKLLVFIIDRLQKKDTYGVFSELVDPKEMHLLSLCGVLPDYFDIVENPMDFSTARKKLDKGAYTNLEQFEKDVLLICLNAMQYNSPDTIYYRQDFENLRQDSDDSEPQPKVARRGRPHGTGKLKNTLERSLVDRVGPETFSDATLATGGDSNSLSNGYNLRRSSSYKYQPADALIRVSHGSHINENHSTWLSEWENEFPASVVKSVIKYENKLFMLDENKRDTYKHSLDSHEPSILMTFEGELKQLMAQKQMIHPAMNGFMASQMFGAIPTNNNTFISMPGNNFNLSKAMLSEASSEILQYGISAPIGSISDSHTLGNMGFGGKSSWQGFLPYYQQGTVPFSPDLNVGFMAPGSLTSSVAIGSPQQLDLVLQL